MALPVAEERWSRSYAARRGAFDVLTKSRLRRRRLQTAAESIRIETGEVGLTDKLVAILDGGVEEAIAERVAAALRVGAGVVPALGACAESILSAVVAVNSGENPSDAVLDATPEVHHDASE